MKVALTDSTNKRRSHTPNVVSIHNSKSKKRYKTSDARETFSLLDAASKLEDVRKVLSDVTSALIGNTKKNNVEKLDLVSDATTKLEAKIKEQLPKIAKIPYATYAYDHIVAEERLVATPTVKESKKNPSYVKELKKFVANKDNHTDMSSETPPVTQTTDRNRKPSILLPPSMSPKAKNFSEDAIRRLVGPPSNRIQYTKHEIFSVMETVIANKNRHLTASVLNYFAKSDKCHFTNPTSIRTFIHRYNAGKDKMRAVGVTGREKIASLEAIYEAAKKIASDSGQAITDEHIEKALIEEKKKQLRAEGLSDFNLDASVHETTVRKYLVGIAMKYYKEFQMTNKDLLTKTETRWIAENSLRGAYAYAITVMSTHFVASPLPREGWGKYDESKLPLDTKLCMKILKELHGGANVIPVHPYLVLNTDDTTLFAFEGTADKKAYEWKLVDPGSESGTRSDYVRGDDKTNGGGLRVRLTKTTTAAGMAAPPYVCVSGLTEEELPDDICEDGILTMKIPGLCGARSTDVYENENEGYGFLVFTRADKSKERAISIAEKKFTHYHQDVLIPFIKQLRRKLGWIDGEDVPDHLQAVSWFDGDIPQLQSIIRDLNGELEKLQKIIINKHSASGTGTQQACDLEAMFKMLKRLQKMTTAAEKYFDIGYSKYIYELINSTLKVTYKVNLSLTKRKALVDFLICLPENLEKCATRDIFQSGYLKNGMIDKATRFFPSLLGCLGTCRRKVTEDQIKLCMDNVPEMIKKHLKEGESSNAYDSIGIPPDYNSLGDIVTRPTGPNAEHTQYSKTINNDAQKEGREVKKRIHQAEQQRKLTVAYDAVNTILDENSKVEEKLLVGDRTLADVTIADFLKLKVAELKVFVHARLYNTPKCKALPKKTLDRKQTAEEIQRDCNKDNQCLVWLAWSVRNNDIVLKKLQDPSTIAEEKPSFVITYVTNTSNNNNKKPSEYLDDKDFVNMLQQVVVGVDTSATVNETMKQLADELLPKMKRRLERHISLRISPGKQQHPVLKFVEDNLPPMAAALFLTNHVTKHLSSRGDFGCLLNSPEMGKFQTISSNLESKEGCYLYYCIEGPCWIRSGKTVGSDQGFKTRHMAHEKASKESNSSTIHNKFYSLYPSISANNNNRKLTNRGSFENLRQYCGMGFDRSRDNKFLCANHPDDKSIVFWSKSILDWLSKREGGLKENQLHMVGYLWEIVYDLLLDTHNNVSESPGFEAFGLRF